MNRAQAGATWAAHHVIALPEGASLALLLTLAQMRFPAARLASDQLHLSRHSRVIGPVTDDHLRAQFAIPAATPILFSLQSPRERGEPPFLGLGDRTGIARACPNGLPIRDEERVLNWAVAAARRLGGTVRIAPSGTILRPDMESSVDLTILSSVWLDPPAARKVVSSALPHAAFHQPDLAKVIDPPSTQAPSEKYGLGADLEADGRVDVLIGLAEGIPPAWQPLWKGRTPISYEVCWTPLELAELEMEDPPLYTKSARRRAFDLVARTTSLLHGATGGQIVDDDWFLVAPEELV